MLSYIFVYLTHMINNILAKPILLLFTLIPILLFGQETMQISNSEKEVFHVLKSDQAKRHGTYQRRDYFNDCVRVKGFYKNSVKDSVWSVFNDNGELEQQFDYTHNKLVYYKLDDSQLKRKYKVIENSRTFDTMLERPPLYIGGDDLIFERILQTLQYPDTASKSGISGDVLISFIIGKDGKTRNHIVKKGIGYGCDEEALKVVREIPDTWVSGILRGHAVDVEMTLAVNFSIQTISLLGQ